MSQAHETDRTGVSRGEWVTLLLLLVSAAMLRCALPSHMSVEHFDEGVYVSNLWFSDEGFRYPDAHLYAPPLFPWIVEWTIAFVGPSRWACMGVSLVAGTATVALIWWVGRCWFGTIAGLSAALLAAFSDIHILYSRAALTDALLCFWLLLAVYLIWESYRRSSVVWAVLAGLATALTWWTKYTGWLPLAIGIAGLVPWSFRPRGGPWQMRSGLSGMEDAHGNDCPKRSDSTAAEGATFPLGQRVRCYGLWLIIVVVAFAAWSPVLIGLQDVGGYSAVAANHRSYVVGLAGWWDAFRWQRHSHDVLNGWLSCSSIALAWLLAFVLRKCGCHRSTWNGSEQLANGNQTPSALPCPTFGWSLGTAIGAALLGVAATVGSSVVLGLLAVLGILWQLVRRDNDIESAPAGSPRQAATWLLAAWFVGMSVSIPFYRPYPRLTLPWLIATWLGAGALLQCLAPSLRRVGEMFPLSIRRWRFATLALFAGAAVLLPASMKDLARRGVPGWQDRTSLQAATARIIEAAKENVVASPGSGNVGESISVDLICYVYAEPAVLFHLNANNVVAQPVTNLDFARPDAEEFPLPLFLIVGPHALHGKRFPEQFAQYRDRFVSLGQYRFTPSRLVSLNDPETGSRELESRNEDVLYLYRLK